MANNPNAIANLKHFKPGQSGNPAGRPPGIPNLSQRIQSMLNDPDFEARVLDAKDGYVDYKGEPIIAIIKTAITKAVNDGDKAREWLAKYGYGQNIEGSPEELVVRYEYVNKIPMAEQPDSNKS